MESILGKITKVRNAGQKAGPRIGQRVHVRFTPTCRMPSREPAPDTARPRAAVLLIRNSLIRGRPHSEFRIPNQRTGFPARTDVSAS